MIPVSWILSGVQIYLTVFVYMIGIGACLAILGALFGRR